MIPMELTPKVFDDVEFRERFRGYDPDEVDAFLEQVARSVQELDQKLKDALDRAEKAEARAREAGDADEALRRTLVLAQRTADAAVSEAETRAAALLAEAEGKAATTVSDADRQAAASRGEAEAYALRTREHADAEAATKVGEPRPKVAEMLADRRARRAVRGPRICGSGCAPRSSALEALREHLRTDAGRLEAHIAIQRQRVLATVEALQRHHDRSRRVCARPRCPSSSPSTWCRQPRRWAVEHRPRRQRRRRPSTPSTRRPSW